MVDEHQPPGVHARDLAAQLAADRPSGAGHHDHLVGEVGADTLELHADRLAAEHVLDADLAQLARDLQLTRSVGSSSNTVGIVRTGIPRLRQAATTRARSVPGAEGIAITTSSGSTSSRILREVLGGGGAEHLEAVLVLDPLLARIVVDEPDRPHPQLLVARELAHDQAAAVAAADDQHVARALLHAEAAGPALDDQVHEEARAEQQHQHQQEEHRDHAGGQRHGARQAPRGRLHGVQQRDCAADDDGRDDYALDHRLVVALTDERPQPLVQAEQREHDHRDGHDPPHRRVEQVFITGRSRTFKPEPEGKKVGERDQ